MNIQNGEEFDFKVYPDGQQKFIIGVCTHNNYNKPVCQVFMLQSIVFAILDRPQSSICVFFVCNCNKKIRYTICVQNWLGTEKYKFKILQQ